MPTPTGKWRVIDMVLPDLIQLIEQHADKLTAAVIDDLKSNPRTGFLHSRSTEDLENRAHQLYSHLGRWIAERDPAEIDKLYGEAARRLHAADVPLSEVVYVVILLKRHLWDFVKRNVLVDSINDLYQLEEMGVVLSRFFDEAIYVSVKTYESIHTPWKDPQLM